MNAALIVLFGIGVGINIVGTIEDTCGRRGAASHLNRGRGEGIIQGIKFRRIAGDCGRVLEIPPCHARRKIQKKLGLGAFRELG